MRVLAGVLGGGALVKIIELWGAKSADRRDEVSRARQSEWTSCEERLDAMEAKYQRRMDDLEDKYQALFFENADLRAQLASLKRTVNGGHA